MEEFINNMFDKIMIGDGSVITSPNIEKLNNISLEIYNKAQLSEIDIDLLKKILMICNVLYNRTDLEVLPINDSFYDLLLEKYKTYDSNFQVGSAVVEMRNLITTNIDHPVQIKRSPFRMIEKKDRNETHQDVYDQIMRKDLPILNKDDFRPSEPLYFDNNNEVISKRVHDTTHNHPDLIGSLDKCKFVLNADAIKAGVFNDPSVKVFERDFLQKHLDAGIINPNHIEIVCELKYDGVSVEADCTNIVESARTRGDTGAEVAADITPLLYGYTFKHADCMIGRNPIGVKFEAIITKSNLERFTQLRQQKYSNGRTAIIGLLGSSDGWKYRDLITLIPLAIDRDDVPEIENRMQEIEFINTLFRSNGEPLRYCYFAGSYTEILYFVKTFWEEAKDARSELNFMYDGIVVGFTDESIRKTLGRSNYINKYQMAIKFDPEEKQTYFRGYTYEVGQNGLITPMIHYDPVEFIGTIHTKSTGSSLDRFNKLGLRYGDIINVTYRNDVMPYVTKASCEYNDNNPNPVVEFITHCPICGEELVVAESGKNKFCVNMECPARSISRMTNMMSKLNMKGFADATFKMIPHIDHLYKMYQYDEEYYISKLGVADGTKLYKVLHEDLINNIKDYVFLGALGFSNVAQKKWESIMESITPNKLLELYYSTTNPSEFENLLLQKIDKIGPATAHTIAYEFPFFEQDIMQIINLQPKITFGDINHNKAQIRFSGCRNLQLETHLINRGYDANSESSVTKATNILLVPYIGFESNKTRKASPNCQIIAIEDFQNNIERYLYPYESPEDKSDMYYDE